MTIQQIKTEIENTKKIMDSLLECVKGGQTEYYKDYLEVSMYYIKLNKAALN